MKIIALVGARGVGKSTVAQMVTEATEARMHALATPLKHFARCVFGWSRERLYGPSEHRDLPDKNLPGYPKRTLMWSHALDSYANHRVQSATTLAAWSGQRLGSVVLPRLDDWWYDYVWTHKEMLTPRHVLTSLGTDFGRQQLNIDMWVHALFDEIHSVANRSLHVVSDVRFINECEALRKHGAEVWHITRPDEAPGDHASEVEMFSDEMRVLRTAHIHNVTSLDELRVKVSELL